MTQTGLWSEVFTIIFFRLTINWGIDVIDTAHLIIVVNRGLAGTGLKSCSEGMSSCDNDG